MTPSSAASAPTGSRLEPLKVLWRRVWRPLAVALAVLIALMVGVSWYLRSTTSRYIYTDLARVPARPVGIVFGAMVYDHNIMGQTLKQRVKAGVALYKAGKVQKLLLSGKDTAPDYDEVGPMTAMTEQLGVPASAIITDGQCYRTYDSCYRARAVFHIQSAILVTQNFHLPRALFLARHMGIDAVGYTAPPPPLITIRVMESLREFPAALLAPFDLKLRERRNP
ncbi:MAG TPA: ElyC/SanA/YdcF family protein [Capsulimonadaceae bacterium]|nr:ElyC/SanA/YdcF family protein [Capsulimonadaceae bacterium]